MRIAFKIGFILIVTLGYAAWALWCYSEFGVEMTPLCLGSWAFMVLCKMVVGAFIYAVWDSLFLEYEYGMPSYNPPPPPKKQIH